MNLTNTIKERIKHAMRVKGIKGKDIAIATGMGTSWVSKLLKDMDNPHSLKSLTDQQVEDIEHLLDTSLIVFTESGPVLGPVQRLNALAKDSPELSEMIDLLVTIADKPSGVVLPWVETKDMDPLGQRIIRIAHANDKRPGKVAKLVLQEYQSYADKQAKKIKAMIS